MRLVVDATVLINFGGVEAGWILRSTQNLEFVVVTEVLREVQRPPASREVQRATEEGWLHIHQSIVAAEVQWLEDLKRRAPRLGMGELASLAACLVHGWGIATDDRDGRRLARAVQTKQPLHITGTIGLLVNAVHQRVTDPATAEQIFQAIIAHGFRAPIERLSDVL